MKKSIIIIIIAALLVGMLAFQSVRLNKAKKEYNIAVLNNKAYESQLDLLQEENKVFQFRVEQLEWLNDSTMKELDSTRKVLGIKDKQLKQMSKIRERIYIHDSIAIHDTIFKEPNFIMDTCLGDKWYMSCLHMEYPNQISSQMSIVTDLSCFIHSNRETVNPPKKTWLGRLFQKKHTVVNVIVKENNPYSNITESKFIKILDK